MSAITFVPTRYGYTAEVVGLQFHLRAVNLPTEPALYTVYSRDYDETTCGDLIEARAWLTAIEQAHADSTAERPANAGKV